MLAESMHTSSMGRQAGALMLRTHGARRAAIKSKALTEVFRARKAGHAHARSSWTAR